ncbi:amidohydrolase family protein [Lacimicrobium alkaliphilum]|uniref:Amidohydrolase n=1 Tax=Lacimicrobium alkaliphilum TaxID=1526571 RepID=A0ABQ1R6N1_9ALTE|nr:amidohydrolase family protein [Lacimicrobium alkaliphilum]GGD60250.1 amidohydrolase [Lacimicrobium alkaliphilum]
MKISSKRLLCLLAASLLLPVQAATLIKADKLYTSGEQGVIETAYILIDEGKIQSVSDSEIQIPAGTEILTAKVVLPGLIDSHTLVGINGAYNVSADQDAFEQSDPTGAEYRVLDSFNPAEKLIEHVRKFGTTTIHVTPQPFAPIGGATALFKTHGDVADQMLLKNNAAMLFNLGEAPKSAFRSSGGPGTRMATAARIRGELYKAREWMEQDEDKRKPDLAMQALANVLSGEMQAIFTAHREDDIGTALRIAREFGLTPLINYGTEAYLIRDELKQAGATVIMAPTMQRPAGMEKWNTTLEAAAIMDNADIPFVFAGGYEGYVPKARVLLWETAVAIANGLDKQKAIEAATIVPARLWGIDKQVGSIETGKDADLVLFDGDPFEYTTHVKAVLINGEQVD